ncbi:hypothetical protein B0I37DRAFT_438756 [Chaetomium sp. MPI-CAGE-AT-0009]|nr:hypothetical protein B0I37DRAFT_438756 [Chaetomium sp. MPI-CAGE-AT-0009]
MPPPQLPQNHLPLEYDPSLEAFNIPVQDWLAANPQHQLIVSALVSLPSSFSSRSRNQQYPQPKPQTTTPKEEKAPEPPQKEEEPEKEERTLLLQRAPTDWDPLTWEHPGGTCETHETVLQAVARELAEETGLVARRGGGDGVFGGLPVVRLDPAEHCAYVWATEAEVRRGWCGDVEMRWGGEEDKRKGVILRGFEVLRQRRALAGGRGAVEGE